MNCVATRTQIPGSGIRQAPIVFPETVSKAVVWYVPRVRVRMSVGDVGSWLHVTHLVIWQKGVLHKVTRSA